MAVKGTIDILRQFFSRSVTLQLSTTTSQSIGLAEFLTQVYLLFLEL